MNNKQASEKSSPDKNRKIKITDESMQILLKEYDTLKDFFGQTESIIQGIFNFYITFLLQ